MGLLRWRSYPRRVFLVAQRRAGHVLGAFERRYDGRPWRWGLRDIERPQVISTRHARRSSGVPQRWHRQDSLKLAHRDDALSRGIELIEWTYDPLEIKNSYLNITRLGASAAATQRLSTRPSS